MCLWACSPQHLADRLKFMSAQAQATEMQSHRTGMSSRDSVPSPPSSLSDRQSHLIDQGQSSPKSPLSAISEIAQAFATPPPPPFGAFGGAGRRLSGNVLSGIVEERGTPYTESEDQRTTFSRSRHSSGSNGKGRLTALSAAHLV